MTINDVLDKYFRDKGIKVLYFHSSDAHKDIEGDTYLTYKKYGDGRIELWVGSDNGELCLTVTDNPEHLESLIKIIARC